jgi:hypothetical protein
MGILKGLALPGDDVCEMWLGPCGVHYYHVHKRDDDRWMPYAGGDPIARRADPGRLYVRFTTAQPDWVHLSLRSAMAHFPKARRFAPEAEINIGPGVPEFVHVMDASAKVEAGLIIAMSDKKEMSIPVYFGFEQRFMAKMALGVGYNVFGAEFLDLPYTKALRALLWEQNLEKRAALGIRGVGFLDGDADQSSRFMGWPGAYTIRLQVVGAEFVLSLHFPSSRPLHIVIANEPSLWAASDHAPYREGVVFLSLPQLPRFAGPFRMIDYISHRNGNYRMPTLDDIETRRIDPATLPACR